ncbi:hypothetical protein Acy02nite_91610 [Actinoplanes cyaneus]|uniref:Uncharacterized protein n=1 Tax=Actinoplanes cyaneus TaxID=52696 RepID=A0A919IS96_9ACTN|nr:hypothetical protein [Actinoplanes cyaneus]MCW2144563.1 hypothetical protein [Actinoplanes cyaneus]GID71280.1 hypothetical protein Acy02nite_91610 [Actinoplanes cyaneus]
MIVLVVAAMVLLGSTTWLALEQPVARDPMRNRRLTIVGLLLCGCVAVVALTLTLVTSP